MSRLALAAQGGSMDRLLFEEFFQMRLHSMAGRCQ